jgi:hypothetical protein
MSPAQLFSELDSRNRSTRLLALETLRNLERLGISGNSIQAGPCLPSYDHVHTVVSYGDGIPGLHSVSRMVWAAHEAQAFSTLIVEHESLLHCEEATEAVGIVNEETNNPLQLALGVEFKAPLAIADAATKRLSADLLKRWGQGDAAWVVGMGVRPNEELTRLVKRFQTAKRQRAEEQLERLCRHFAIMPAIKVSDIVTPEGNITDRSLCYHVARIVCRDHESPQCNRVASEVRKLLNPGQPGYVPYPSELPCYQDLLATLQRLGMTPTFTAQLRGEPLENSLQLLKAWGIRALDVAGIEPYEPDAERDIQHFLAMAEKHHLQFFGGADYRGAGTGWQHHAAWMDAPLIRESLKHVAIVASVGIHQDRRRSPAVVS